MNPIFEVQEKMGVITQFILDNLDKQITQEIQAEFNILYGQYNKAIKEAESEGISEQSMIDMNVKSPIEIPKKLHDKFEEYWLDLVSSLINGNYMKEREFVN